MLTARQERTVLVSLTLGIIQLVSALIAVVLTVYLIPNEIERRTIYTILSKPVQRWQFLVGKYLGAVLALGLMMALMTAVLVIVFAIQQQEWSPEKLAVLAKAPTMFFVQMSIVAALAVFFSTFVSPLVNFFLTGGLFLVGSLFNVVFETMKDAQGGNPITKGAANIIHFILPNFGLYNVQNPIINPGQVIENETLYYINGVIYGLFYIGVLLIAGILIFDRREV